MMVWADISSLKPLFALEQHHRLSYRDGKLEWVLGADAASKVTALSFLSAGSIFLILGLAIEIWVFVRCFHTCFFFSQWVTYQSSCCISIWGRCAVPLDSHWEVSGFTSAGSLRVRGLWMLCLVCPYLLSHSDCLQKTKSALYVKQECQPLEQKACPNALRSELEGCMLCYTSVCQNCVLALSPLICLCPH